MTVTTQRISFWHQQLEQRDCMPAAQGVIDADVCIVGGGLTGLWAAYYLIKERPDLRIVILERRFVGYGASGRNGGWLSNFIAGSRARFSQEHGKEAVIRLQHEMDASVDEVVRVTRAEQIDADVVKSGVLTVARSRAQLQRLRAKVADDVTWGEEDQVLLDKGEIDARLQVARTLGAAFSPHCARTQPAKLTHGLAERLKALGVKIYEQTEVTAIERHAVRTPAATVKAEHVVLATEGFTSSLPGYRRRLLPMNSSMIVTNPIPDHIWEGIGWNGCELLGDMAHMYFYAQRTSEGRIAFGGRGYPYRYAARFDPDGYTPPRTVKELHALLVDCFPVLRGIPMAHAWSGVLGVPRDWCSAIARDTRTGVLRVGGYVGHGLTTTNLAGRTVRDLILRRESSLTSLPWVNHSSRAWEPEPARWLGVQAIYTAYRLADRQENKNHRNRTSRLAEFSNRISGR